MEVQSSFSKGDDELAGLTVQFRLSDTPQLRFRFRQSDNTKVWTQLRISLITLFFIQRLYEYVFAHTNKNSFRIMKVFPRDTVPCDKTLLADAGLSGLCVLVVEEDDTDIVKLLSLEVYIIIMHYTHLLSLNSIITDSVHFLGNIVSKCWQYR